MTDVRKAYIESVKADAAYSDELVRVYGLNAGDARYDNRGTATPLLASLAAQFVKKSAAWRLVFRGGS